MQVFGAEQAVTRFSPHCDAAGTVMLGESFVVCTVDCYDGQITGEDVLRTDVDMARFNRATGPVAVQDTEPGQWVRVVIERIEVTGPGVMVLAPGLGVLGSRVERPSTRILEVADGRAWLTPRVGIPLRPMVGVLGVSTAEETVPSSVPGDHGGNLDTRALTTGRALALRVNRPGLGLAAGDLHAAMGEGELGGTGIEVAGRLQLRVEPLPGHEGHRPLVLGPDGVQVLASRDGLNDAVRAAFDEAVALMGRWHGLAWGDAYRLTSVVSDLCVSQVVNPRVTARVAIPASWCPAELTAVEPS
jgi:amidase